jgi:hypothetical protein
VAADPSEYAVTTAARLMRAAMDLGTLTRALDAAREEGREACHADRDHAEADRRAEYAARLGIDTAATWDDILGAAILEGHRRAVEETAIASIHKAVAAERAAVVTWLRAEADRCAVACEQRRSHDAGVAMVALRARADAIERGDHHHNPKELK